jgi:uncharacterized membrane protein
MIVRKDQSLFKCATSFLIVLALLVQAVPLGLAVTVDRLSNGKTEDTVDFPGASSSSALGISVPFDASVTAAGLAIKVGPHTTGGKDYPLAPRLDIGGDGDTDWAFEGTGYGAMGHQTTFSNGSVRFGVATVRPASNTSASIKLPKDATALSAAIDIDGNTGYDPWDVKKITLLNQGDIGYSATGLGDVNGDGFDDIGATMQTGVMGGPKTMIWFGEYGGFGDAPDITLNLGGGGKKMWGIGDVNGDGLDDIVIGTGVHFGGAKINASPDVTLTGLGKGNNFGSSVSNIGDIDGDGYDDILVGDAGDGVGYYGGAYIYYGGQNMDGTVDKIYDNPTGLKGQGYGDSVTYAGDLNNDTYDDLAISAMWGGPANVGMAYIYYGGVTWDNTSDLTLLGDADGGAWPKFGNVISGGGDLNDDGYDDLVVGAFNDDKNGTDAGKVYVFYGGNPMDANKDLVMFGSGANTRFGTNVDIAKDLNGDKVPDIIASSGSNFGGPIPLSYVRVYFGGQNMDNDTDWSAKQDDTAYMYGSSAGDAGDIIGMGRGSVIVGAPGPFMMGTASGRIYIYNVVPMDPAESMLYLENQKAWNFTGVFKQLATAPDFSAAVNAALKNATDITTDGYGNKIADLVVNLTCPKGTLNLTNISIEYSYQASAPDFSKDMNDFLVGKAGPGNVTVPLNITVSSAGKVTVRNINVTFAPNAPPVAIIDSIAPNPVRVTKNVTFQGHGTDTDGTVQAYRWSSDRSGLLSLVQNPILSNLSVGKHNISLEVMDNRGRWSAPAHEALVVLKPNIVPQVTISKPTNGQVVGGLLNITGTAQDPDPDPLSVWVGIDQGPWSKAEGNTSWHYLWDTKKATDGDHTIRARVWDTHDNSTVVTVTVKVNNTQVGDKPIDFEVAAPQGTYIKAGGTATYDFTVRNLGNLADTYVLKAETTHRWAVSLTPSALSLDPGKSGVVKARFTVPATASKGTEVLWLNVTSNQNKSLTRSATVSTNIMVEDIVAGLQISALLEKTGTPGAKVDIVFTIRNIGTITDDFSVTAGTDHGWSVELVGVGMDGLVKDVPMNGTAGVTVRVTVPANTVGPLQEGVNLNASSKYDPTKTATARGIILVGRLSAKVISPANQTARPEAVVSYEFEVRNTGDFKSTFLVSAASSNGWQVGLTVTELTIDAGGSAMVNLTVTVPKGTKSGTKDELKLTVTAKASPDIKAEGKVTTTVKAKGGTTSAFSLLPAVLVIVAAAVAGGIAAVLYSRRKKGKDGQVEGDKKEEMKEGTK